MVDILSLLISLGAFILTIFLEFPKILERLSGHNHCSEKADRRLMHTGKLEKSVRKTTIPKSLVSIGIAILYGMSFGTLFIPLGNDEIVGYSLIVFCLLSLFWAFRYIRYKTWNYIKNALIVGFVSYIAICLLLGILGFF